MSLALEEKNEIYDKIIKYLIEGLESGDIEEHEARRIAEFSLENIENIENKIQLEAFYEDLSGRWSMFESLLNSLRNVSREKMESEVSEGAVTLLKHGKVDDALKLAKTATEK